MEDFVDNSTLCSLTYAEHLTIWAMRAVAAGRAGCPVVTQEFEKSLSMHAEPARRALALFTSELGGAVSARLIQLSLPGSFSLSGDEVALLNLFRAAQLGRAHEARIRLRALGIDTPSETLIAALNVYAVFLKMHGFNFPGRETERAAPHTPPFFPEETGPRVLH